jgi:type I restriction enzyme R subunit
MRFERDLLEYSLAVLSEEKEQAATLKEGIVLQISELPLSVGFVKQAEALIRAAQSPGYWAKADEDAFDTLVAKLGPLMKFRETSTGTPPTHLDLADELHKKEWVEFGPQNEAVSVTRYREMVESLIAELTEHNPVLKKLKNGEAVTEAEAQELASLLHEEHPNITEALLRQVYNNRKARFIQFIRHILGLEVLKSFPEEVSAAFDRFIRAHTTLSSQQLEFLNLLKDVIIEREKVEKKDLIHAPFTVIHPQGIRGVFGPAEINEVLQLTERLAA